MVNPGRAAPSISLLISEEFKATGFVQLLCLISGYYPESIAVSWKKNGKIVGSGVTTTPPAKSPNGLYSSTSFLKLPLQEWGSDSAYSCQVTHSATNSNTRKEIRSTSELALFLRDPSVEGMWLNKSATLMCEVVSTLSTEVAIVWIVNGQTRTEGVRTEATTTDGDQYLTISRLTSSVEEWDSGAKYSCSAQQGQSGTPISKRTGQIKAEPTKPILRLLPPSPEEIRSSNTATLTCLVRGFYPDIITISWEKNGVDLTSKSTTFHSSLEQHQTFSTSSLLILPSIEWKSGAKYTCTAFHLPSQSNETRSTSYPKGDCHELDISVKILNPSFEEIWTQQTATMVCEILYTDLENVSVSWQVNGTARTEGVETRNPEWIGSKSIIVSKLKATAAEWDSGVEYVCVVGNSELPTPEKTSARKVKVGEMHPPKVYVLPPSMDEIDTEKTATMVCLAIGFYPTEIYVAWMVNDTLLDADYPCQLECGKGNGTLSSRLRVTAAEWNSGNNYSCLVGHPSLKRNLIRSINKSFGKPTLVNVSLVLTDSFKSCI